MHEFDLIQRYFAPLSQGETGALQLKDDAAVVAQQKDRDAVYTKDILISDVHFFASDDPFTIAQKLWAVNLSDLAAMGASPKGYLLGLALPSTIQESWIEQFAAGVKQMVEKYGGVLWGGDTTSHQSDAPIVLSLTAIGEVPDGKALKRSTAQVGDDIYVTGTIGDAHLGLKILDKSIDVSLAEKERDYLVERYYTPIPRLEWREVLRQYANSCVDISDGLAQDIEHIANASLVKCQIEVEALPLSQAAQAVLKAGVLDIKALLSGGDDYELVFTAPATARDAIVAANQTMEAKAIRIGKIVTGQGVEVLKAGQPLVLIQAGYRHFS